MAVPMGERAAILLAAGESQRMGSPKALLPWSATTLLGYIVEQLRAVRAEPIVVVLGAAADKLRESIPPGTDISVILNEDYQAGRSTSVRRGALEIPVSVRAVMVQNVDQPARALVLGALFSAVEVPGTDVAFPSHLGRRGHPVCFAGRLLPALRSVDEATLGLRAVVEAHAHSAEEVPVMTDDVLLNLNDPVAYASAYAREPWS